MRLQLSPKVSSRRMAKRKRQAYPTSWSKRIAWTWSSKPCPYCGLRRWSWKRLVQTWARRLSPDQVQVVFVEVAKPWPKDAETRFIIPRQPKRECKCSNKVNPRWGP